MEDRKPRLMTELLVYKFGGGFFVHFYLCFYFFEAAQYAKD